jgi:hypothetical protein
MFLRRLVGRRFAARSDVPTRALSQKSSPPTPPQSAKKVVTIPPQYAERIQDIENFEQRRNSALTFLGLCAFAGILYWGSWKVLDRSPDNIRSTTKSASLTVEEIEKELDEELAQIAIQKVQAGKTAPTARL